MKKLLIVETSNIIPDILSDLFAKSNYFRILKAKTFDEAKILISKHNFFATISCVVLPDAADGEIIEYLNEKMIPTVVLTSKTDSSILSTIKNKSISDYISKDSIYELKAVYRLIKLLTFTDKLEVLVVDDSTTVSQKLKNILETFLLKVNIAKNGSDALEILKDNPSISLVLTDYNMDGMDGLELIKNIRKSEALSNIPVMIMTSLTSDELKTKFYKNGATDFLTKPILEVELKAKITNIFFKMKQIQEIRRFNNVVDENVITSSTNASGIITHVSKAFCEIAGYERHELIGKTHNVIRHPDMPKFLFKELWTTIKSGKQWKGEVKNLRKDGSYYWVKVVIEPNFDKNNEIVGYTSVRQDITDRKKIYEISITDGLTSLYNRRYFNEIAQKILDDTTRNTNIFGFLILDIDNFKKYNDTYGHQKGDDVLMKVSDSLKETFKRDNDKIFRLGGEEFGILISSKEKNDVLRLAAQAKEDIELLNLEHEKNPPLEVVTASFGLVIISSNTNDAKLDTIYKLGDDKLYEAKENGKNRVEYIEI